MTSIQIWLSRGDQLSSQAELHRKVWEELRWEATLDATRLSVDVTDCVATLGGTVASYAEKVVCERAARRVPGVQAVKNEIGVALPPARERSDRDLTRAVKRALEWDIRMPRGVTATVAGGWVTLVGQVLAEHERRTAEEALHHLAGLRGITNLIVVKPQGQLGDLKPRIEAALKHCPELRGDHVKVDTHDGTVVLRGHVRSLAERDEAERAAWEVPGVTGVEDDLKIGR